MITIDLSLILIFIRSERVSISANITCPSIGYLSAFDCIASNYEDESYTLAIRLKDKLILLDYILQDRKEECNKFDLVNRMDDNNYFLV